MPKDYKYYRLTKEDECHNRFQYHDGLNIDTNEFNPTGSCQSGGLYFFSKYQLIHWQSYTTCSIKWCREVHIPADAKDASEVLPCVNPKVTRWLTQKYYI